MKRLSKVIALLAAMIMVMAMSSSVFATNYSAGEVYNPDGWWEDKDVMGPWISNDLIDENDAEAKKLLDTEEIEKILAEEYVIPDGAVVVPIDAKDVKYGYWDDAAQKWVDVAVPAEGVSAVYWMPATDVENNKINEGDTVYVLHYNEATKAWEIYEKTVQKDSVTGELYVTCDFSSLSPVGIVRVMDNGQKVVYNLEKKSPKTGL